MTGNRLARRTAAASAGRRQAHLVVAGSSPVMASALPKKRHPMDLLMALFSAKSLRWTRVADAVLCVVSILLALETTGLWRISWWASAAICAVTATFAPLAKVTPMLRRRFTGSNR